jgi:hypothetical protein
MLRGVTIFFALFICLLAVSCGGGGTTNTAQDGVQPDQLAMPPKLGVLDGKAPAWDEAGAPDFLVWDVIFGQHYPYGTAEVILQDGAYYMKYTLTQAAIDAGWRYIDAAVNIWTGNLPSKADVPGQYPYKWSVGSWDAGLTEVLLPLGTWVPTAGFNIAIHASLRQLIAGSDPPAYNNETGWGGLWWATKAGKAEGAYWTANWKKWGGYMTKADTLAKKLPLFAPFDMTFHAQYTYALNSYWQLEFTTSPPGPALFPFVWDYYQGGSYTRGWCCDPQYLGNGGTDTAKIYSCYDPNLPDYAKDPDWDVISYMIDQRYGGAAGNMYFDASVNTFQKALWYFKYGNYQVDYQGNGADSRIGAYDAATWALIDDATIKGENYVPSPGDWFAGVLWPGNNAPGKYGKNPSDNNNTNYQMLIVGIDP